MQLTPSTQTTRPRRQLLLWVGAAILVLGLGGGLLYYFKRRAALADQPRSFTVTRKDIAHTLQIAGKVMPNKSTVITAHESGRIIDIMVNEGSQVKQGALLFTMLLEAEGQTDLLQKRAEVRALEMQVAASTKQFSDKKPVQELIGSAQVAKDEADLEKLKLDLRAARERLAVLENDLGLSLQDEKQRQAKGRGKPHTADVPGETRKDGLVYITAPNAGIVTLIDKRPGDFVVGGATASGDTSNDRKVMVVADMSTLQIRTRVLEADLRYVHPGLPVKVRLDAYPDVTYSGAVEHIGGQGRTDAKAGYTYFDVFVNVAEQDARLLPEMNATVELIFEQRSKVLAIPVAGVVIFPDRAFVHVPDAHADTGFKETAVQVGVVSEADAEILSGLKAGDSVLEIDFAALQLGDEDDDSGSGTGSSGHKTGKPKHL